LRRLAWHGFLLAYLINSGAASSRAGDVAGNVCAVPL
jgi:hypothetical protein